MLTWIIQISVISIIFIFLVHHLIIFFKTTLTVPKIKDLVNSPNQKYQNIYNTISNNSHSYTAIDLLPTSDSFNELNLIKDEPKSMKDELKSFLKKQLNSENDSGNVIGLEHLTNNFSNF